MKAQLRSELLKVRSTRTAFWFALGGVASVVLGVLAQGLSMRLDELATEDRQRMLFGSATGVVLFAAMIGLISVTNEFRYGTIRPTLLFEPRRRVVLAAKLGTAAVVGIVLGALGAGVAFGVGRIVLSARHVDVAVTTGRALQLAGGLMAGSALCAMLGVGVGALVRNQVGAIVGLLAWSLVVEGVLFPTVPSVGRFLPGRASDALVGLTVDHLLSAGVGAAVLVAWTLVLAAAADVRTARSDVS